MQENVGVFGVLFFFFPCKPEVAAEILTLGAVLRDSRFCCTSKHRCFPPGERDEPSDSRVPAGESLCPKMPIVTGKYRLCCLWEPWDSGVCVGTNTGVCSGLGMVLNTEMESVITREMCHA